MHKFLWFICILCSTTKVHSTDTEIPLDGELWKEKYFFEYGSPLITSTLEQYLRANSTSFISIPKYTVLENSLEGERNVYVFLENTTDVSLHLYGEKHPNSKNYKFNITSLSLEKCVNTQICRNLSKCSDGVICKNDTCHDANLPDGAVFLSWRQSRNETTIFVQYKSNIIKCHDFDPIEIKKIVLYGTTTQKVVTTIRAMKWMENANKTVIIPLKNYNGNQVSVIASTCWGCDFNFYVNCENKMASGSTNVVFSNGCTYQGWANTNIFVSAEEQCNLTIERSYSFKGKLKQFWSIALISVGNSTMTSPFLSPSPSPSPSCQGKVFVSCFFIISVASLRLLS